MMRTNSMIALIVGIVAIAAVIYLVTARDNVDTSNEPTTALGHAIEGIGDKIDQGSYEAKAEASESSAESNFDAAKKDLGIGTDTSSSTD